MYWNVVQMPPFGKLDVRELLNLISGGERELTAEQLQRWRELIMFAVASNCHVF